MTAEEYKLLQDRIKLDCERVAKLYAAKKARAAEIKKLKGKISALESAQ